jgi:uncharacterized membrane protein (DUF2068 family)
VNGFLIRLIIVKKVLVATVLLLFSVTASLSSMDMQRLARQTQLWADADRRILVRLAQQGLDLGPDALRAFAVVTGIYALLVYLAAWATWTERLWGDWLLVGLLVLPLPFEIRDLVHEVSPSHLLVLGLTIVGLIVLLKRALAQTKLRRQR